MLSSMIRRFYLVKQGNVLHIDQTHDVCIVHFTYPFSLANDLTFFYSDSKIQLGFSIRELLELWQAHFLAFHCLKFVVKRLVLVLERVHVMFPEFFDFVLDFIASEFSGPTLIPVITPPYTNLESLESSQFLVIPFLYTCITYR